MAQVIALPNGRRPVGYEFVRQSLDLSAFDVSRPATIRPVSRVEEEPDHLAVPLHVAPQGDDPLEHLLFALKHEGTNLQVLAQALRRIPGHSLATQLERTPMGGYIRVLAHLWESFNGVELPLPTNFGGGYAPVFDPQRYVTGPTKRNAKWRVDFNGLGDLQMCATVRRTVALQELQAQDTIGRTHAFLQQMPAEMVDRALAWAYLAETRGSYAIEKEEPSQDRAEAFARLLKQAHEPRAMNEEYLVELQNAAMTNPRAREMSFRPSQNWLQNGNSGALGVTYVPPPPHQVAGLMDSLMGFANAMRGAAGAVDPLVLAAVVKFAFVFVHPFIDGNGRLSRFLFHYTLAQSGALPGGMVLPVSVAMKRHEAQYLQALQSFSRPARSRWGVRPVGEGEFDFEFRGEPSIYQFWDATAAAEFSLQMAAEALQRDLFEETHFLGQYDRLFREVNAAVDAPNPVLSRLVTAVIHEKRISKNLRKRYANYLDAAQFDRIEELYRQPAADDEEEPQRAQTPGTQRPG